MISGAARAGLGLLAGTALGYLALALSAGGEWSDLGFRMNLSLLGYFDRGLMLAPWAWPLFLIACPTIRRTKGGRLAAILTVGAAALLQWSLIMNSRSVGPIAWRLPLLLILFGAPVVWAIYFVAIPPLTRSARFAPVFLVLVHVLPGFWSLPMHCLGSTNFAEVLILYLAAFGASVGGISLLSYRQPPAPPPSPPPRVSVSKSS